MAYSGNLLLLFCVIVGIVVLDLHTVSAGDLRDLMLRCPDGSFGFKCKYRCRCHNDEPCDKVTGACYYVGCQAGFWGPGCQLGNNCFYNGQARHYQGHVSVTANLFVCQRWDTQTPHRHSYNRKDFPDEDIPDNFCRTTKDSSRPWCYTTDKKRRWEHCNVNNCNCPLGRFGHNCAKECHCKDPGEACDSIMGMCQSKCATGWSGFDCQTPDPCPMNRYGWDCSQECYCRNPDDCDRFTGPTPQCVCKEGYFNAPYCEAENRIPKPRDYFGAVGERKPLASVTRPRIIHFANVKVNQGEKTDFNCTVEAHPTPRADEIRLIGPITKHVTLIHSEVLLGSLYSRSSLFQVNEIGSDEKYTCSVKAIAGEASFTTVGNVYQRPMLVGQPRAFKDRVTSTTLPLEWLPWNMKRGDVGDPPIERYGIWVRSKRDQLRLINTVSHMECRPRGICNFTLTDLKPNTEYRIYVTVRREGDNRDGPPGPMIYVKTKCDEPSESPIVSTITNELMYNDTTPKARLTVHWQDAPVDTWNCDSIRKYQLLLANGEPEVLVTHVAASAEKQFQITKLDPGTRYCVSIRFENNRNLYSPTSQQMCVVTPTNVPSAPKQLKLIRRSSTSLTFSWERPKGLMENITVYTIIYWKGFVKELVTKKGEEWKSGDPVVEYTLEGLEPHTSYHIQIQAVNAAGSGEYSAVLTATTLEGTPGSVSRFRNMSRTQTSIMFQWQPPHKANGELLFYYISCSPIESLITQPGDVIRLPATMSMFNYTGLEDSSQYRCSINASTAFGSGSMETIFVWTEATDPVEPPSPTILGRSDSTVTIELTLPQEKTDTVSFYRVIVEQLEERRRRSVPESVSDTNADYYTARRDGLPVYVAAQLTEGDVGGKFVVGDNLTYGGFTNAPLNPNIKYNIWFGAYTKTDGGLRKSISKAVHRNVARPAITAVPPTNHVPVIICVLIVFIVLILVVALLLIVWRKKHIQSEREKAEMPNFGPTIIPEPDLTPPSTPIEHFERDPLLETVTQVSDVDSEPIYGNIGFTVAPVKVEDLWDYVKNNKCNDIEGFRREYKLIPAGITACCDAARRGENKTKNRYGNIVAYDHSRVLLGECMDEHDDYINANYIDGYNKQKAYIAAQGPTKSTLKDIWRMVWQEQSKTIIMLTNPTETGKKKCESYWPEDEAQEYHGIIVECLSTHDLPDITTRVFKLSKGEESRLIKQFHYTTWPDHGVPKFSSSLLLLRQKIRAHDNLECGPQVIHCSAGVGRTGSYIAIDVELERAKTEGIIDVHNFVQLMRTQRINMVQTLDQYVFVYDCLLEALISGDTLMRADEFPELLSELCQYDNVIQKTKLEEQFDILRLITTTIERDESTSALKADNLFKNRSQSIVPANRCRPYLMTPWDGCNDYINAIFSNTFTRRDGIILTQMPLPNTVIDFWRMIHDHNVAAIVMLNELDPADESCHQYWTLESCGEKYGPFIIETTAEIKSDPSITLRDFTITNTDMPHAVPRVVRQFHFHRWNEGSVVPSSKLALFELLEMVDTCQRHSGNRPVVVHCINGADRSGVYAAVSILIERLKLEKEIDVFQTVKQLRLCRTHLVDNLDQYRYCHEIALDYINSQNMNSMTTFAPSPVPTTHITEISIQT